MATVPTYVLAPNFTYIVKPGEPTWLGNIIADPCNPLRVLTRPEPPLPDSSITVVSEKNNTYTRSSGTAIDSSLWASFLQFASTDIGLRTSKSKSITYSMTQLDTRYLQEPTDEEIKARIVAARVQAAMNSGTFGRKPVFMITGLKIAKGLRLTSFASTETAPRVGAEATVTPDTSVSVGTQVAYSRQKGAGDSFESVADVIFAYQLHIIAEKGWKRKRLDVDFYKPKAALLTGQGEVAVEYDAKPLEQTDVEVLFEDELEDGEINVNSADGFVCIRARDDIGTMS